MTELNQLEAWFVTGSQHLYGNDVLEQVAAHSQDITGTLDQAAQIPVRVVFKPVMTGAEGITALCQEANAAPECIGLITWMHTFSPAKMWIAGLHLLNKPFMHLHTQFNRDIPWSEIDMDFMNLNQSAHGGREFGYICSRMGLNRKVVVGHWQEESVHEEIGVWGRAASAWLDSQGMKVARFGDNMREVAVTEGDKVESQIKLGWSVNGYGIGDLTSSIDQVSDSDTNTVIEECEQHYRIAPALLKGGDEHQSLRDAVRIELGLRALLEAGGFKAFTTTFENLHGLTQLPGLAVQRLMADGYGFGAEGDWKTAALLRVMKTMGSGLDGGTSFMEDYTYHFDPSSPKVLGAHMLEVCSSIAVGTPTMEIHPLSIGGKGDPVRLVFDTSTGPAINASLVDLGGRFRLLVNNVTVVDPDASLPKLPVARAVWAPEPNLKTAAAAWILAGGAHHTGFSQALSAIHMEDFAEMAGIEILFIDDETQLRGFKNELKWNQMYYQG
jgi:L-arabinose isomerase